MNLTMVPLYAAIHAVLVLFLAYRVVGFRQKEKIGLGSGESKGLELAIRVHANAIEYVPLLLILLLVLELSGAPAWLVHASGALSVVARVLHALGLGRTGGASFGRFWGTALTWLVILGMAGANLVLLYL